MCLAACVKGGVACIDELGVPWYDFGSIRFGLVEHCIAEWSGAEHSLVETSCLQAVSYHTNYKSTDQIR